MMFMKDDEDTIDIKILDREGERYIIQNRDGKIFDGIMIFNPEVIVWKDYCYRVTYRVTSHKDIFTVVKCLGKKE